MPTDETVRNKRPQPIIHVVQFYYLSFLELTPMHAIETNGIFDIQGHIQILDAMYARDAKVACYRLADVQILSFRLLCH